MTSSLPTDEWPMRLRRCLHAEWANARYCIKKAVASGGLATNGIINLFVPLRNGRGIQITKGMAEEFLRLSIK